MPLFESTAWELIESAAHGGEAAKAEFVRRYTAGIRNLIRMRWRRLPALNPQIDDAAQDVFLECLKPDGILVKADRRAERGFRPFLEGVTRNVAKRYEQQHFRSTRNECTPVHDGRRASPETSVSHCLDREWARSIVRDAAVEQKRRAAELSLAARIRVEILKLRFQDGLPIREIARQMELEPRYVHHQFAKARTDFLVALRRVLASRTPGLSDAELDQSCRQLMEFLT